MPGLAPAPPSLPKPPNNFRHRWHDLPARLPSPQTRDAHDTFSRLTNLALLSILSNMAQNTAKLAAFLASARSTLDMSLRAVEKETGISNAYLSQLEHGRIKTPSPRNLYKLARLYRVPYELLMDLAGYPIPKAPSAELQAAHDTFAARIGAVTEEEEEALVEYLQFIRSRRRRR